MAFVVFERAGEDYERGEERGREGEGKGRMEGGEGGIDDNKCRGVYKCFKSTRMRRKAVPRECDMM